MANAFNIKIFIESKMDDRADQLRNGDYVYTIYGDYIFYIPGQNYPFIKGNKCIGMAEIHNLSLDMSQNGNKTTTIQFSLKSVDQGTADAFTKMWRGIKGQSTSDDVVIPGAIQFSDKEKRKRDRPERNDHWSKTSDRARRQQEAASKIDTSIFNDFFDD